MYILQKDKQYVKVEEKRTSSSVKYLKINKRGVLIRSGGSEKNQKINKHPGTNLRVKISKLEVEGCMLHASIIVPKSV